MQPESIAVLGGGLTGLSAAFHLSRRFPTTRITIINKDTRFGGWALSESVRFKYTSPSGAQKEANVVFETGPRTLRADSLSVLELIHLLDLTPSIVPKPSAVETKPTPHFLHIPGSRGIHRVPTSPLGCINPFQPSTARLGRIYLSSLLLAPFRVGNRPLGIEDESVDAFYTRRFGAAFAQVFGSAASHSVYFADARKLSIRALHPSMWDAEERGRGSVSPGGSRTSKKPQPNKDMSYELGGLQDKMHRSFVYSFKDGIGTLADALVDYLQKQPNVQMYGEITTSSETLLATHVVSALPLYELEGILSPATPLPHLTANTYSSVTVVQLVFPLPISFSPQPHPDRFAYVVSRPAEGYSTTNGNGAGIIGCISDPLQTAAQNTTSSDQGITKMTVMLGGPYISDPSGSPPKVDIPALLSELSYQLDRPLRSPVCVKVYTNVGCVPLYSVGHVQRVEELKNVLASEPWNGRMEVVGAGVAGTRVGDCVEAGRNVGSKWSLDGRVIIKSLNSRRM